MRKLIPVIGLAVAVVVGAIVAAVLLAEDGGSSTPKGKVFYAQERFICERGAQGCSFTLSVSILRNEGDEDVEDLMFRFYNANGDVVHERKWGEDIGTNPIRIPASWTADGESRSVGFDGSSEEEIARYDVVAVNKQGKKCICVRAPLLWVSSCFSSGAAQAVSASDQAAIEEVMRAFFTAFNARDFDECLTYFTEFGEEAEAVSQLEAVRQLTGEWTFEGIEDMEFAKTTVVARVQATIGGWSQLRPMVLKEVDGFWKLIW